MEGESLNLIEERIQQLRRIFPDVFSEGKIDFNRLRAALGENVLFPGEHYELDWAGKAEARREVQRQTTATLVPDPDGSFPLPVETAEEAQNIFIEGENLETLRVLQKSYFGKVKMIYIDPPYNTGNDSFVYPDDFAERQEDYLKRTGAKDQAGFLNKQDLWKKNSKENGQFHSVWLSMMYPRLYLARNLMREDGVIFVSIDDNEVANLRLLMDEVFGEENFVGNVIWQKKYSTKADSKFLSESHEYILTYAKSINSLTLKGLERTEKQLELYKNPDNDPRGSWASDNLLRTEEREYAIFEIVSPTGKKYLPPKGSSWRFNKEKIRELLSENRIWFGEDGNSRPRYKRFLSEVREAVIVNTLWKFDEVGHSDSAKKETAKILNESPNVFSTPKPVRLIQRMIKISCNEDDLILDFFAGSGTVGQAVLELNTEENGNRRFILVQMPEPLEENSEAWKAGYRNIAEIGRARIRKVIERLQAQAAEKAKTPGLFEASENGAGTAPGFRSYRLRHSNFKVWRNDLEGKEAILNQLQIFQEPLAEYRGQHQALLVELVLKAGLPLTVGVAETAVDGCPVFDVDKGRMWIALDKVSPAVFQAAAAARPAVFVALGGLFAGAKADETMANAKLQLKDAGVDFRVI